MHAQQKARLGGRAQSRNTSSAQNSIAGQACTCFRGQARASRCIVCLAWARLFRHLQAMRQAVTS